MQDFDLSVYFFTVFRLKITFNEVPAHTDLFNEKIVFNFNALYNRPNNQAKGLNN